MALLDRFIRLLLPWRKKGDPSRWFAALAREHLAASGTHSMVDATSAGRCIHCGACAALDPQLPSLVTLARMPADARHMSAASIDLLEREAPALRWLCPTGVDAALVARWYREAQATLAKAA